jgi:2-haloacid dehalogenase
VLKAEPPELMMVSAHSFDAVGARASGYRAAYVNRYDLPYDETPYRPDLETRDFVQLAAQLGCT